MTSRRDFQQAKSCIHARMTSTAISAKVQMISVWISTASDCRDGFAINDRYHRVPVAMLLFKSWQW